MKKVLIYMREGCLSKTGGPIGYNYALKSKLDELGITNIHYLPGGVVYKPGIGKKIKNKWYGTLLKSVKDFCKVTKLMYGPSKRPPIILDDYDIIHFHSCKHMYEIRNSLSKYKGKVVLTSHSPRVSYQELIGMLTSWEQKHMHWYYKKMIRFDEFAFDRADYIIFPCPEAEEPYYNTWPYFKVIKEKKAQNFRYLLTGTYQCKAKIEKSEILKRYNIPENSFVISYVGRHNEVKGFDNLKSLGEKILPQFDNVYFLIAGEESPIKGLVHPRWIEIGWTNDPHSIIAASDLFILPNKETYFDLIMIEVLSLGRIVLASNTGGNKYFKKYRHRGVMCYDNLDEAVSLIKKIMTLSKDEISNIEKCNKELFEEELNLDTFAKGYIKLIDNL